MLVILRLRTYDAKVIGPELGIKRGVDDAVHIYDVGRSHFIFLAEPAGDGSGDAAAGGEMQND